MVYIRLLPQIDRCQHFDQCGVRHGVRIEDALIVVETLISKTLEWNLPLWMAIVDLKKAFDRVEHSSVFATLRQQDIDDPNIALLLDSSYGQHGNVQGGRSFDISRGVRQGDVINSLLFNAVIEHVFQHCKRRTIFCFMRNHFQNF